MLLAYKPLTASALSPGEWRADFDHAERIKDVRFGEKCVHLGRFAGLGGRYIPYHDITRWYIRIEAATGGESTFHNYRLVVCCGEGKEWAASLGDYNADLNEKTPVDRLRALTSLHPEIPFSKNAAL